jgi:hypothetical protein
MNVCPFWHRFDIVYPILFLNSSKERVMSQPNNARDESLVEYLVTEFIEEYQEGKMSRRDALKRIAGLVGGLAMAESLLAACAPPPTLAPTTAPTAVVPPQRR